MANYSTLTIRYVENGYVVRVASADASGKVSDLDNAPTFVFESFADLSAWLGANTTQPPP